ncbi:MAG: transaldolase [Parcubacteria group bacterium]|nr:transaldolase [Parcubacteria group bacterium]
MKIFIDTADVTEIKKYLSWGICNGVTTNPTIFFKHGVTGGMEGAKKRVLEIAELISTLPISLEVTSEKPEEILTQAKEYSSLGKNISVKVTITDREGNSLLPVIQELVRYGISVNVTAITTFNQAILAAKTIQSGYQQNPNARKPSFVSVFAGRISEEQGVERAREVIGDLRRWLDFHNLKDIEIIVGSIRSPENVEYWSKAGAHILTIPPEVIGKLLHGSRTKETVAQFIEDGKKSLEKLG